MTRENLIEGVWRSLRANPGKAALIVLFALLATTALTRFFPVIYETHSILRVISTEDLPQTELAVSMRGLLEQRPLLQEIFRKKGLEFPVRPNTPEIFRLEDAGPGLVKLVVRYTNPAALDDLGSSLIKTLSEQYLSVSSENERLAQIALEKKRAALEVKLKALRAEAARVEEVAASRISDQGNDWRNSATLPGTELPDRAALEKTIHELREHLAEDKQKLTQTPPTIKPTSQEDLKMYSETKTRLAAAHCKLNELMKRYREKHPKVIQIKEEIDALENALNGCSSQCDTEQPNPEFAQLEVSIDETEKMLAESQAKLDVIPVQAHVKCATATSETGKSADAIQERIQVVENMYRNVVEKVENISLRHATTQGCIKVLKRDRETPRPIGISFMERQMIGFLSGALLAVVLLYSPAPRMPDIVKMSGASMMGPTIEPSSGSQTVAHIMQAPALSDSPLEIPEYNMLEPRYDERLMVMNQPNSPRLKPFRKLRSNLEILLSDAGTRLIMVASSRSGMGRTMLTANLGALLAQDGYSVCLIDADFRKPALHRVFDQTNHEGLSMILSGQGDFNSVRPTEVKNLSILTSGPLPENPPEQLGAANMIDILDSLKQRFELVIIDTPALLEHPDAGILAALSGGVVFLHRRDEIEADVLASRDILKKTHARLLGVIEA
ncbi:MAG: polysaccharide biosynthesis tyrosine autokinase [Candidatus Riflebacteria bacterium]|nr:polysaccharide biosynthesis tyrosine autokinase [Candidatus Riflebacteria bacterium]